MKLWAAVLLRVSRRLQPLPPPGTLWNGAVLRLSGVCFHGSPSRRLSCTRYNLNKAANGRRKTRPPPAVRCHVPHVPMVPGWFLTLGNKGWPPQGPPGRPLFGADPPGLPPWRLIGGC